MIRGELGYSETRVTGKTTGFSLISASATVGGTEPAPSPLTDVTKPRLCVSTPPQQFEAVVRRAG